MQRRAKTPLTIRFRVHLSRLSFPPVLHDNECNSTGRGRHAYAQKQEQERGERNVLLLKGEKKVSGESKIKSGDRQPPVLKAF